MNYIICKLNFHVELHIGNGNLSDAEYSICADTFFSALCHEAIKSGGESSLTYLVTLAKTKKIRISDGFPFIRDKFYVPTPLICRRVLSKMDFLPMDHVRDFLHGNMNEEDEIEQLKKLGKTRIHPIRGRSREQGHLPSYIGTYQFYEGNGIYFIIGYQDKFVLEFIKNLLTSLQFTGIGGKKSIGLGRFWFEFEEIEDCYKKYLCAEDNTPCNWYMTLSVSLPLKEERFCLDDAVYKMIRRGGYICSETYTGDLYADEDFVKKREISVIKAGACMKTCFKGQVANVNNGMGHDVYRYALPMFWRLVI